MNSTQTISNDTSPLTEVRVTEDGSSTLYLQSIDEHYHSVHGAVQESNHVFIESALALQKSQNFLKIFEVGFGTGLNALLTLQYAIQHDLTIHYYCIEQYPISFNTIDSLNYGESTSLYLNELFGKIHRVKWGEDIHLTDQFILHKIESDFTLYKDLPQKIDIVYFDAFSPDKQPEMWDEKLMSRLYNTMKEGGVLTTYCAKGSVRRTLQSVGFTTERIPGPPGKREMLRATKQKQHDK